MPRILPRGRIARLLTGIAALAVIGGVALMATGQLSEPAPTPEPTPTPMITATMNVAVHPPLPEDVRARVANEIGAFLDDVYERAFLPPLPAPTPGPDDPSSPLPTPIPRPRVADLFTPEAQVGLGATPDIFRPAPDETVFTGEVTIRGIATVEGDQPTDALVEVTFAGEGRLVVDPGDPESDELPTYHGLRMEQEGDLRLVRTPEGWRIAGFDISLTTREEIPATPGPEGAAPRRVAHGRWMP